MHFQRHVQDYVQQNLLSVFCILLLFDHSLFYSVFFLVCFFMSSCNRRQYGGILILKETSPFNLTFLSADEENNLSIASLRNDFSQCLSLGLLSSPAASAIALSSSPYPCWVCHLPTCLSHARITASTTNSSCLATF